MYAATSPNSWSPCIQWGKLGSTPIMASPKQHSQQGRHTQRNEIGPTHPAQSGSASTTLNAIDVALTSNLERYLARSTDSKSPRNEISSAFTSGLVMRIVCFMVRYHRWSSGETPLTVHLGSNERPVRGIQQTFQICIKRKSS